MFYLLIFLIWITVRITSSSNRVILDDNRTIDYSKLKYDLDSLFTNTPTFSEPIVTFNMGNIEYNSSWRKVADLVLHSKIGRIK